MSVYIADIPSDDVALVLADTYNELVDLSQRLNIGRGSVLAPSVYFARLPRSYITNVGYGVLYLDDRMLLELMAHKTKKETIQQFFSEKGMLLLP